MSSIIVANIEPEHKSCKKEDVTRRWPRCICMSKGAVSPTMAWSIETLGLVGLLQDFIDKNQGLSDKGRPFCMAEIKIRTGVGQWDNQKEEAG